MSRPLATALAIGLVTLAWRAVFDKIVALRGGAELVATWAQLQSIADLVSGVVSAGIAPGVAVLVAQTLDPAERRAMLGAGLRLGAWVAAGALVFIALLLALPTRIIALNASSTLALAAAGMGFIAIAPTLVSSYWTGSERRGALLAWAIVAGAVTVGIAASAPRDALLAGFIVACALPAVAIALALLWWLRGTHAPLTASHRRALARYIMPSLAIGVFSPMALIVTRAATAQSMSIADVGVMQAIWRSSEWMTHLAAAVMSVIVFPQLSAARDPAAFRRIARRGLVTIGWPTAIGFTIMALAQRDVLAGLYDASFVASHRAVAAFYLGEWLRLGAWLYLYALYARHATRAVAIGEFLSLPLFALLVVVFSDGLTLERAGLLYLAAFAIYLAFNHAMIRRVLNDSLSDSRSARETSASARSSAG